ncbi:hypothetical protein JYU34_008113 [Plutella xylostella]|uniref:C2H2-type domain-containing protein n=1 Tax=Plutella xylostella TaxID=51655 RepID=A0ABQ7QNR4_PLUXY|nr:hypothetical protein JYU34_008113 [Plutella xylostella]
MNETMADQELCTGCLSRGRELLCLIDETDEYLIYKQILYEISIYDPTLMEPNFCWECRARLRSFQAFKERVQKAYMKLSDYGPEAILQGTLQPPQLQSHAAFNFSYPDTCDTDDLKLDVKRENSQVPSTVETCIDIKPEPLCPLDTHTEPESFAYNLDITNNEIESLDKKIKATKKKVKPVKGKNVKKTPKTKVVKVKQSKKKVDKKGKEKSKISDDESVVSADYVPSDGNSDVEDLYVKEAEPEITKEQQSIKEVILTPEEVAREREDELKGDKFLRNQFKCSSCILGFRSWIAVKSHNETCHHEKAGSSICNICNCRFASPDALLAHSTSHTVRYQCAKCDRREKCREILEAHVQTHVTEERTHECDVCGHVSNSLSLHQTHMSRAHDAKPQCVECGKTFSSRKTYRYHLNVLHKGQNRFPCPHCGKVYQWKSNLWRHIKNHKARDSGDLFCAPCNKRFASIATYRQHVKISRRHVSESEFNGYIATYRQHVKISRRHVSESEFNFMCTDCGSKFVSRAKLKEHVDWEHLHRTNYTCAMCDKAFKSSTSLYVHLQNVHKNKEEKDNLCHVCGKSYQSTAKLKYHIVAMHTGATPYTCAQCPAAFSWYSSLYRHTREVHGKIKGAKKSKKPKKPSLAPILGPASSLAASLAQPPPGP